MPSDGQTTPNTSHLENHAKMQEEVKKTNIEHRS